MTTADFEPDQDLAAAEAPHAFQFGEAGGEPTLSPIEATSDFPDQAMDPVQGLLWLGYLTEEVWLFGHTFTIKTLTRGEKLAVALATKEWEDTLGLADAYQTVTVAAALMEVDHVPIASLDRGADRTAVVGQVFERVRGWYDPVVEALFERVIALEKRQVAAFMALQGK